MSKKEVEYVDIYKDQVNCNLCGKLMTIYEYENHYEKCMDIEYLVSVAKEKGEEFGREDLEDCRRDVIEKLMNKYPPKKATELLGAKL